MNNDYLISIIYSRSIYRDLVLKPFHNLVAGSDDSAAKRPFCSSRGFTLISKYPYKVVHNSL